LGCNGYDGLNISSLADIGVCLLLSCIRKWRRCGWGCRRL